MNKIKKIFFLIIIITTCQTGLSQSGSQEVRVAVKPGIEVLLEHKIGLVRGKRVGLITNPTGVNSALVSTVDLLYRHPDVELAALFAPEHGVRGDFHAGETVGQNTDIKTGIPVFSLYGKNKKPTPEMLHGIDILIYDIQDTGTRGYTYIYTMAYAMEAARENNIPFFVLDRPNPLGGNRVEGNVLEPDFSSFIGLYPIAQVYGMTVGELARFFNQEFRLDCQLTVIPMMNWRREMTFAETGLPWVPTSPHIPHAETVLFSAATGCIGELNTVSIGVGYPAPFELFGAPWIDADKLAHELNHRNLPGVFFRPIHFRPYYLHFKGEICSGVQIHIRDQAQFSPAKVQIHLLEAVIRLFPEQNILDTEQITMFDSAFGTDKVRKALLNGKSAKEIIKEWQIDLEKFRKKREKYLIY